MSAFVVAPPGRARAERRQLALCVEHIVVAIERKRMAVVQEAARIAEAEARRVDMVRSEARLEGQARIASLKTALKAGGPALDDAGLTEKLAAINYQAAERWPEAQVEDEAAHDAEADAAAGPAAHHADSTWVKNKVHFYTITEGLVRRENKV